MNLRNAVCLLFVIAAVAGCNGQRRAAELDSLQKERQALVHRLKTAEEEQRFLAFVKGIYAADKRYLVLDTQLSQGSLKVGTRVLRTFPLVLNGCRKPAFLTAKKADAYVLPKGRIQVIAKMKDPAWYKPDWLFENMAQPPPSDSLERLIQGPLGGYALFFGHGFVIHGRPMDGAPPMELDHACIVIEDDDLRVLFQMLATGSFAYIR